MLDILKISPAAPGKIPLHFALIEFGKIKYDAFRFRCSRTKLISTLDMDIYSEKQNNLWDINIEAPPIITDSPSQENLGENFQVPA